MEEHRSQIASRELVEASDLIVVMEAYQVEQVYERFGRRRGVVVLGDFDPQPIATRAIVDPWNKPREIFVASYARIDRCLLALSASVHAAVRARAPETDAEDGEHTLR